MSNIYDYRKSPSSETQRMNTGALPEFNRKPPLRERVRSLGWGLLVVVAVFIGVCAIAYVATHEGSGRNGATSDSEFSSVIAKPSSP